MPSLYNTARRELVDVGVDWMTATVTGAKPFKRATAVAEQLLHKERDRGNDVKRATREGYAGFQCGGVFAGAQSGTMLMRLSGKLAADHWREVYSFSSNVSRLDLQATVRYSPHVPRVAERVERDVLGRLGESKKPLDVGIIRSRVKGSTCVIGRRVSDRYGRVYNKHLESGSETFAGCWRWELELKRRYAKEQAARLFRAEEETRAINGELLRTFAGYGASRLWALAERAEDKSCSTQARPDSERVCAWLRSGVRGRVQWLVGMGRLDQALEALGLADLVTIIADNRKE